MSELSHRSADDVCSQSQKILLVDASPYIFRSYFALPSSMVAPDGRMVNATYGFAGFLIQLLEQCQPEKVLVAFDGSLTTSFRNEIYPAYKAQRELPPESLVIQVALCREAASALGLMTAIDDQFEADDLLASSHHQLVDAGELGSRRIVSSDKDLGQLVDDRTLLWDFARDELYDAARIEEKFGVRPDQLLDYQALAGDAVDNIPGVKGVGPKTASALLRELETLDIVLSDLDRVAALSLRGAKSLARKLSEHRDSALMSKQLAALRQDLTVAGTVDEFSVRAPDATRWQQFCDTLGFDRLAARGLELGSEA